MPSFSGPDHNSIVITRNYRVRTWDVELGGLIEVEHPPFVVYPEGSVQRPMISPDGRYIAFQVHENIVVSSVGVGKDRTWTLLHEKGLVGEVLGPLSNPKIICVAFSPDGRYLASGTRRVRIWEVETGRKVAESPEAHRSWVTAVAFSPDGKRVVSDDGKMVRIWNLETRTQLELKFKGHRSGTAVAFSWDGKRLSNGTVIRDLEGTDENHEMELTNPHKYVTAVAFSLDGKRVICGTRNGTVGVWDAEKGTPLAWALEESGEGSVAFVAFSPDGKRVLADSDDKTLRVWDLDEHIRRSHQG